MVMAKIQFNRAVRGHPNNIKSTMRRKISGFARWNSKLFIGKTSGEDGLKERFNNKYKQLGFDAIVAIYVTDNEHDADEVETMAIEYANKRWGKKFKNLVGGGGGPEGTGTPKIVYIAKKK